MNNIPPAMLTRGRGPDQLFDRNEQLCIRIMSKHIRNNSIDLSAINLPDLSVNRMKHKGCIEYVLMHDYPKYVDWGVLTITVERVPNETYLNGSKYEFRVVHDPIRKNFFHTEIRCFDDTDNHIESKDVLPIELQMRFRDRLRFGLRKAREPFTAIPAFIFNEPPCDCSHCL